MFNPLTMTSSSQAEKRVVAESQIFFVVNLEGRAYRRARLGSLRGQVWNHANQATESGADRVEGESKHAHRTRVEIQLDDAVVLGEVRHMAGLTNCGVAKVIMPGSVARR